MAWNPTGAQPSFPAANGFTGFSNDVFSQPIASFGIPATNATGNAFGFDPSTMSAFSFNFGAPAPQTVPNGPLFAQTGSAFGFTSPPLGNQPLTGTPSAIGFAPIPAPSSLYDLVSHPAVPSAPTQAPVIPTPDIFGSLSIEDIKRGFSTPSSTPSSTTTPQSHTTPSSTSITPTIQTQTPPTRSLVGEEMSDFAGSRSHSEQASLFPIATESTPQKKPVVSGDVNPKTAPKSASELLASIDLSKPSDPPTPATTTESAPSTPYSNAAMVKSTIDWSKQRDLMASFLTSTEAPKAAEHTPPKQYETKANDEWSGYGDHAAEGDDWSSFDNSGSAPHHKATTTAENTSTMDFPSIQHGIQATEQNGRPKSDEQLLPPEIAPTAPPFPSDVASLNEEAFRWNAGDSPANAFGFDPSTFDTSAFNFSGATSAFSGASAFSFPPETLSTPSSLPIHQDVAVEKIVPATMPIFDATAVVSSHNANLSSETSSSGVMMEISPNVSSHAQGKSSGGDLFSHAGFTSSGISSDVEFGGFTSHSSEPEGWSAFPDDTVVERATEPTAVPSALPLSSVPCEPPRSTSPNLASPSVLETVPSPGRKKPENGVLDLSHFQLPSMPATPTKPTPESTLHVSSHKSSLIEDVAIAQISSTPTGSLIDDEVPSFPSISTSAFTAIDFGAFSGAPAPVTDLFASPNSTPEVPAWMQSNRSTDSTSSQEMASQNGSQSMNWKEQPTMDELKKRLLEVLGTDKSAPYMWIFDNLGKHITITFEERHSLAVGLIEDVKSGKTVWLSSSRVNQWHSVLTHCGEDLQRALSYLSNVAVQADLHSEEILRSYLAHPKTVAYMSSLVKIKKVASRILSAALHSNTNALGGAATGAKFHTPKTTCCYLKPSVLKAIRSLETSIEHSWHAIQTQVKEMMQSCGEGDTPSFTALVVNVDPVPHAPISFNCYLCYRGFDEHEGPIQWQEKAYHATCANFWTHCISTKPPSL